MDISRNVKQRQGGRLGGGRVGRVCPVVGEVWSEMADWLRNAVFRESEVALLQAGNWVLALPYDYVDHDEPRVHFYVGFRFFGFVWR